MGLKKGGRLCGETFRCHVNGEEDTVKDVANYSCEKESAIIYELAVFADTVFSS